MLCKEVLPQMVSTMQTMKFISRLTSMNTITMLNLEQLKLLLGKTLSMLTIVC